MKSLILLAMLLLASCANPGRAVLPASGVNGDNGGAAGQFYARGSMGVLSTQGSR
jgi:hypothetical protein